MSNLSDKEIDRLSREAADFYDPDHSSLSWTRLEQKLIEQIPERPPDVFHFGRINPFLWGSAVVVIAGASFFVIKNIYYSKLSTLTVHQIVQSVPSLIPNSKKTDVKTTHFDSSSSVHYLGGEENKNPDIGSLPKGSVIIRNRHSITTIADESNSGKKSSGSKSKSFVAPVPASFDAPHDSDIRNNAKAGAAGVNAQKRNSHFSLPVVVISVTIPGKVTGNDSLLKQFAGSKMHIPYKSLRVNRSLNVGLTFGPDYTDAGGITNDQLGNNIGLTLGYYLTNKLSVNSGMLYTNKFYWAPGHGTGSPPYSGGLYTRNNNMITAAAPPPTAYINGSASMWELPLTLRYDFSKNEKNKFFANAGFSSYFIMKQTYIYFFHSGQRLLAYKTENDEQINYWFKVVNLSIGFESDMGKGFSFQAEPFLKLPLQNMGLNNLKLNSYGFLLSFRYTPVLSRTKK